jgi:hypothetical protein
MYLGINGLRAANEAIEYTNEMIEEVIRCKEDIIYFAEHYFHIVTIDEGKQLITLFDYQKKMLKAFINPPDYKSVKTDQLEPKRHIIVKIARQSGKTTTATIFLLWYALFNKDKTIAILANKEPTAIEILDRIKLSFKHLPLWLQQGIADSGWNKKSIKFENGVKIMARATSPDSISGETVSLLYMDEFAKVQEHIAEEFITSTYPVISSGKTSKVIIVSTPTGMNHFFEFWQRAIRGESNFFPVSVPWFEHPHRDEKWKQDMIKDIGNIRFQQEFACKFLGTASTLIDSDVLEMCVIREPIATKWTGVFSIYEQPIRGKQYILGVDSAKGTGKDYSVIQVLKINNSHNLEQVAVYRNNLISPHDFAQVVISISQYYFDSYMMVENNEVGEAVCNTIWYEYENENLLSCDSKLEIIDGKHKKIYNGLGIRSTRKTKLEANLLLKDYAEKGWLKICDSRTLYELARYEEIRPNIFSCGRDVHDDTITSLLWALFFLTTEYYDGEATNISSQIDEKYRLDNGQNDDEDDNQEPPVIVIDD